MKVCKKCGHPINKPFRYCRTCGSVMYLLQGYDLKVQKAVDVMQERLEIQLSRKEKRRLVHYLTMKRVKAKSNGRFFSKPRQPVLGAWLFP